MSIYLVTEFEWKVKEPKSASWWEAYRFAYRAPVRFELLYVRLQKEMRIHPTLIELKLGIEVLVVLREDIWYAAYFMVARAEMKI